MNLTARTGSFQILGTAKFIHDHQEKGLRLILDIDPPKRLTIDDKLDWQSAQIVGRVVLNRTTSNTF